MLNKPNISNEISIFPKMQKLKYKSEIIIQFVLWMFQRIVEWTAFNKEFGPFMAIRNPESSWLCPYCTFNLTCIISIESHCINTCLVHNQLLETQVGVIAKIPYNFSCSRKTVQKRTEEWVLHTSLSVDISLELYLQLILCLKLGSECQHLRLNKVYCLCHFPV